jgi:hypothetical protein
MAKQEKAPELDQGSGETRTLSPDVRRVILRLASFGPDPLARAGANAFNHDLRGDKSDKSASLDLNYVLTYQANSYYLDFKPSENAQTKPSLLDQAVGRIDTVTTRTMRPIEIIGAWSTPIDGPQVSRSTMDWTETATEVTGKAQEIFAQHHAELIDASYKYDSLFS